MKHHNFIGPTTPNSTHFNPAPSNDRMGMELNRNYDMNHIMVCYRLLLLLFVVTMCK